MNRGWDNNWINIIVIICQKHIPNPQPSASAECIWLPIQAKVWEEGGETKVKTSIRIRHRLNGLFWLQRRWKVAEG